MFSAITILNTRTHNISSQWVMIGCQRLDTAHAIRPHASTQYSNIYILYIMCAKINSRARVLVEIEK